MVEPLKFNVFVGLVRSMPVMDSRTKDFWSVVLSRMFDKDEFRKQFTQAQAKLNDGVLSSDSDDDFDERVRKRTEKNAAYNILMKSVGVRPRGRRKRQRIAQDHLVQGTHNPNRLSSAAQTLTHPIQKRRPGRPKGSKNKPKKK